jgi:hypothetical protein
MNKKPYLEIYLTTLEAKVIKKSFEKFYADYKNDDEVLNNNPETLKYYLIRNELKPNVVHVLRFLPINAIRTVLSLGFHVGNNNKPKELTEEEFQTLKKLKTLFDKYVDEVKNTGYPKGFYTEQLKAMMGGEG